MDAKRDDGKAYSIAYAAANTKDVVVSPFSKFQIGQVEIDWANISPTQNAQYGQYNGAYVFPSKIRAEKGTYSFDISAKSNDQIDLYVASGTDLSNVTLNTVIQKTVSGAGTVDIVSLNNADSTILLSSYANASKKADASLASFMFIVRVTSGTNVKWYVVPMSYAYTYYGASMVRDGESPYISLTQDSTNQYKWTGSYSGHEAVKHSLYAYPRPDFFYINNLSPTVTYHETVMVGTSVDDYQSVAFHDGVCDPYVDVTWDGNNGGAGINELHKYIFTINWGEITQRIYVDITFTQDQ